MTPNIVIFYNNPDIELLSININRNIILEEWTPITEFSVPNVKFNSYYISTFGRVYSILNKCIVKTYPQTNGYIRTRIRTNNAKGINILIHRVMMIEFIPIYNYEILDVNHKDGVKENCFIWNLEWTSHSENIQHAYNNELKKKPIGTANPMCKITKEQAESICRLLLQRKYTHNQISNIVNCSISSVQQISAGNSWKQLYLDIKNNN